LVTADTIRFWLKRVDEEGPNALIQLREPVNKFPDSVRYLAFAAQSPWPHAGQIGCLASEPG
jgi:hypothetical protein